MTNHPRFTVNFNIRQLANASVRVTDTLFNEQMLP